VWNLPARPRGFGGRDDLLDLLHSRFQGDPATPAVHVLSGPCGVGKTAAALEYAYRSASLYETAWWVQADEPHRVRDQMVELARALHLDSSTPMAAAFALRNHLRNRDGWLLVFRWRSGDRVSSRTGFRLALPMS
jgi:hypothetical protein